MTDTVALVVAAGRGHRLGGDAPKQYQSIGGRTVLGMAANALRVHPAIHAVRVVIHPDDHNLYDLAVKGLDLLSPVHGGTSRQDSVRRGLESLAEMAPSRVLIHDAARPFVDGNLISRVVSALETNPGAIPALPVIDTLKRGRDGRIQTTLDRQGLWRAQTPQGFHFKAILSAHRAWTGTDATDDAAVAERAGIPLALVAGSEENIKVTTPGDLDRAQRQLLTNRLHVVGQGYDVHKFCPGDHVMLCGVPIPHDRGLEGHSDADAALHALTDALLGAIGAGDIGQHFPPADSRWKGADSARFLHHAVHLIQGKLATINNVDVTVICERPKIGPHRETMRQRLSALLDLPIDRISVKATTTEGLGFTGRGEGIAALAMVSVSLPGTSSCE